MILFWPVVPERLPVGIDEQRKLQTEAPRIPLEDFVGQSG